VQIEGKNRCFMQNSLIILQIDGPTLSELSILMEVFEFSDRPKKKDRLGTYLKRSILAPKLLMIDEIGYLPFSRAETNLCSLNIKLTFRQAA